MNITDLDDKIIRKANEQNKTFLDVARHFEAEFLEDMKNLNVELPDVITRVSEFIPEIIDFIKKIEEKGYAYRSNGSVYFNVSKFNDGEKHHYNKLAPSATEEKSKEELLKEGEGVLATDASEAQEKQHKEDFALWKKSKEGEPWWDSEFG